MNYVYESYIYSELDFVKPAIAKALGFIRDKMPSLSPTESFELKLILSELLLNAVIHGNGSDINKRVTFAVEISENTVSLQISDEGYGFDHRSFFKNMLQGNFLNDENLYNERGRGIRLVSKLSDSIKYNDAGNEIKLSKRIG